MTTNAPQTLIDIAEKNVIVVLPRGWSTMVVVADEEDLLAHFGAKGAEGSLTPGYTGVKSMHPLNRVAEENRLIVEDFRDSVLRVIDAKEAEVERQLQALKEGGE